MGETTKTAEIGNWPSGLFVKGVVVSSSARVFDRKDGTGQVVCVRHELALQPGLATYELYPEIDGKTVRVEGQTVVEFPRLPELKPVTLRVLRWQERDKRLVIKEAERMS